MKLRYLIHTFIILLATSYGELHAFTYYGYVADNSSNEVAVIDLVTNTVIATIGVGPNPNGIGVTPDLSRAYVANGGGTTVSVVDLNTRTLVATITIGTGPQGVAITPDGKKAYVTHNVCPNGTISVIDILPTSPTYNTVINTITGVGHPYASSFNDPFLLALTPDGTKLYVPNAGFDTNCPTSGLPGYSIVNVIDAASDTVTESISVGSGSLNVAFSPDGTRAYVTNSQGPSSETVSVIDTLSNTVIATIPITGTTMTPGPYCIVITKDGKYAYVTNSGEMSVSVIDTLPSSPTYNTQIALITAGVGSLPAGIGISPDPASDKVYISNYVSNTVSVIDPLTQTVTATITGLHGPFLWGFAPPNSTILPVTNLSGQQKSFFFLTQTDRVNVLTWEAPTSGTSPVSYEIFRDPGLTDLAGIILADQPLVFEDHNRKKNKTYTYYIVAVNAFGGMSLPFIITVAPGKGC